MTTNFSLKVHWSAFTQPPFSHRDSPIRFCRVTMYVDNARGIKHYERAFRVTASNRTNCRRLQGVLSDLLRKLELELPA